MRTKIWASRAIAQEKNYICCTFISNSSHFATFLWMISKKCLHWKKLARNVLSGRNVFTCKCLTTIALSRKILARKVYLDGYWRCLQNMRLCSSRVIESVGNPVYFVVILQFEPLFWQYWISLFKVYLCRVCVCRSKFSSLTNKSPSSTVLIPRNSSILQKSAWEHILLEAIICKS